MSTLFGPPLLMMSHSTNDTILGARSFLAHELPQNVAIMTFQPIDDDHLLLRLAHLHAVGETLGQPVNLSLPDLFLPGCLIDFSLLFVCLIDDCRIFVFFRGKWSVADRQSAGHFRIPELVVAHVSNRQRKFDFISSCFPPFITGWPFMCLLAHTQFEHRNTLVRPFLWLHWCPWKLERLCWKFIALLNWCYSKIETWYRSVFIWCPQKIN